MRAVVKEWRIPPGDDGTGGHREGYPWHEQQLMAAHQMVRLLGRRSRHTAVQAGGNIGIMPWVFAQSFKSVLTFEPDPLNYDCLLANLNSVANVRAMNAALGARDGYVQINHNRGNSGASFCTGVNVAAVRTKPIARVIPLDSLNFLACDLLQLDVEGFELQALQGAMRTIKMHRPVIVLEINACCARYGYSKGDLDRQLLLWDYVEVLSHQIGNDHVYKHRSEI